MGEELIDSFADRAKISDDKQFIVDALKEIYTNFEKISSLKIALSGDASFRDALNTVKQLKTVQDELDASQKKLAASTTEYNKQIVANRLATQQNNQVLREEAQLNQAAEGSLKQKIILLKQLRDQYDGLGTAARKSSEGQGLLKDIQNLSKETTKLKEDSGRFQDNVGNYFGKGLESLKEFGAELITQAALFLGVNQAFDFFRDSIKEYQHAQQEASKLNNILTNIGRKDVFARLKDQSEDLAKEFKTIKSEDLVGVFDQLVVYGKLTENQIKQLTPVIINFAAQTGKSLEESTSIILKGLEGNARGLKEFGINMKDGKDSADRFGIVMDQLAPKVDGAAKAFGETMAGGVKAAEVEIDELKKKVGEDLQPVQRGFLQFLSQGLEGIPQILDAIGDKLGETRDKFVDAYLTIKGIFTLNFSDLGASQAQQAAKAGLIKTAAEFENIRSSAKAVSDDAGKKSLQEQQKILRENEALRDRSVKVYTDLASAGKKSTDEGHKAFLQAALDQQVVANLIQVIERTKDKSILGSGDPDAGGEAKRRESLVAEIKAEAEARLKLLEIKQQERLDELSVTVNNPDGQSFGRIKAAKEFGEIEKKLIEDRLSLNLEANRLEREDLRLTYEDNIKNTKTSKAEKAFLGEKYRLQEKTLIEDRQYLIEKSEDDIFKKQAEYISAIAILHSQALQEERNDETFTVRVLTEQRELYYKTQEELIKAAFDRKKGYLEEARAIELTAVDNDLGKKYAGNKDTSDFDSDTKLAALKKQVINADANNFQLRNEKDKNDVLIALDTLKNDTTKAGLAATQALIANGADLENKIAENKYKIGLEYEQKLFDEKARLKNDEIDLAKQGFDAIDGFVKGAFERQQNGIQDQINNNNKLKEASVARIATETASETTKAAQLEILTKQTDANNEALARKQQQSKQKEAQFEKLASIAKIGASTAVTVADLVSKEAQATAEAAVLSSNPVTAPFAGAAVAAAAVIGTEIGIAIASGAAQIGAVLAQPVPHYKHGVGLNGKPGHVGGKAVVGDGGRSELAVLPDGSMIVTPNRPTVMDLPRDTVVYPDADAVSRGMLDRMVERTMAMMGIMVQESTAGEIRELREEVRYQTTELKRALAKTGKQTIHIHTGKFKDSDYIRKSVYE